MMTLIFMLYPCLMYGTSPDRPIPPPSSKLAGCARVDVSAAAQVTKLFSCASMYLVPVCFDGIKHNFNVNMETFILLDTFTE